MKKIFVWIVIVLAIMLGASLLWNYKQYRDLQQKPDTVKVKTTVRVRDNTFHEPEPVREGDVRIVYVPVKRDNDTTKVKKKTTEDTLKIVGDSVEIPITQKVYEDSLYTAYVSGYRQSLDSITVRERIVTTTITERKLQKQFRRWNVGIVAGYGYGIMSRQAEPFVGIGLVWSPFK